MSSTTPQDINLRESEERWRESTETQRLIDHEPLRTDDKVGPDTAPIESQPIHAPPVTTHGSPIKLAPDVDHMEGTPSPNSHSWGMPNLLEGGREENRNILRDILQEFMILFTAPLALGGMGLYVCGLVIERIAMVLKAIGLLGTRLLMRRRRRSEPPYHETYGWA